MARSCRHEGIEPANPLQYVAKASILAAANLTLLMPAEIFQPVLPLLAAFDMMSMLPAAGVMLIVMAMFSMLRKRRKNEAANPQLAPQEQLERNKQLRGMRGDLEELMVEIEQFAKRLGAQLDAKAIQLETLLKQAERKAQELKALGGNSHSSPRQETSPRDISETASPSRTAASTRTATETATKVESETTDPVAKAVYRLADQGLAPHDIAQKLNEHVGKIELILALRT
ncbi:MAG: hypothetical protein WD768_04310 [Phycisphaeraceae bacterium]